MVEAQNGINAQSGKAIWTELCTNWSETVKLSSFLFIAHAHYFT